MLFSSFGDDGGLFVFIGKKMHSLSNNKIEFILIKFPIFFPIIYGLILFYFPQFETQLVILTIFF